MLTNVKLFDQVFMFLEKVPSSETSSAVFVHSSMLHRWRADHAQCSSSSLYLESTLLTYNRAVQVLGPRSICLPRNLSGLGLVSRAGCLTHNRLQTDHFFEFAVLGPGSTPQRRHPLPYTSPTIQNIIICALQCRHVNHLRCILPKLVWVSG